MLRDFHRQEEQFSSAFSTLSNAIAAHVFPAASVAITHAGRLVALKTFGRFSYETDLAAAPPLSARPLQGQGAELEAHPFTLFDLASVTKAVATTTMAAILFERGLLDLDASIAGMIPEFVAGSGRTLDPRRQAVTFRMLLAHSSGLPAYQKLFLSCHSPGELLHRAFAIPLATDPGSRADYSDIGFIILGCALERIAEEALDRFCQREIFGPLAMTHTTFNPPPDLRSAIPPTADEREQRAADSFVPANQNPSPVQCGSAGGSGSLVRSTFRNRVIQGEVQDENAFVLGGVAGHAGLFSTAEDLAFFAHSLLTEGDQILRPETIGLFTQRQPTPSNTSRALGWDTPSHPSQSGKYFGPRSFGHLGYTGTSLWIDPDRQLSVTLLTNRTWPDCSNQAIRQLRPQFHDAAIEALP